MPQAKGVDPRWRWYMVQTALALHGAEDAGERVNTHVEKALREAKQESYWTNPDEAVEGRIADLGRALLEQWDRDAPAALTRLLERGQALILAQLSRLARQEVAS